MTEYQRMNGYGPLGITESMESHTLDDSVASLISQELPVADEQTTAMNLYRKAAKLFINKKFLESYEQCDQLKDVVLMLRAQGKVGDDVVLNTWSLFFNVVDILSKDHSDIDVESRLMSDVWFEDLYGMSSLADPKLVYLLTLIKLHNDRSDLGQLRKQVEFYLLHASSALHEGDVGYESFLELLELYHVHLLAKLGEFEESQFLIRSNPHIRDAEAVVLKLQKAREEFEEKKIQRAEALKKKEQQLAKRKKEKQLAQERANDDLVKEVERAKHASIAEQKKASKRVLKKERHVQRTVMDVINQRLSYLAERNSLAMILSLIAIVAMIKGNQFLIHPAVRRWARTVWGNLSTTIQMALKVTYM